MASQTTPRLRALAWTALAAPLERGIQLVLIPVRDQVIREAGERLDAKLARRVRDWSLHTIYGQHDAAWLAGFDVLGRLAPHASAVGRLAGLMQVARVAGWWWPFEQVAAMSVRPTVLARDDQAGCMASMAQRSPTPTVWSCTAGAVCPSPRTSSGAWTGLPSSASMPSRTWSCAGS